MRLGKSAEWAADSWCGGEEPQRPGHCEGSGSCEGLGRVVARAVGHGPHPGSIRRGGRGVTFTLTAMYGDL